MGGPRADLLEQYILFLCEINNNIPIGTFTLTTLEKKKEKETKKGKGCNTQIQYHTRDFSLQSPSLINLRQAHFPFLCFCILLFPSILPYFPAIGIPVSPQCGGCLSFPLTSPPPSPVCAGGVLWHRASSSRLSAVRSSTTQACPD